MKREQQYPYNYARPEAGDRYRQHGGDGNEGHENQEVVRGNGPAHRERESVPRADVRELNQERRDDRGDKRRGSR
jgi:hypothetical protein